jgi:hypothetical protein
MQGETDSQEVRQLLDEELQHLPRKYRVPMVLCYLEGQTNEATARSLRCPEGTVKTRLAKGRELLRVRLERRGLALASGALTAMLAPEALHAAVVPTLADATLHIASLYAAGTAGAVSAPVATLMEGALREMLVAKLQSVAGVLLLLGVLGAGAGLLAYHALTPAQPVVAADNPSGSELPEFRGDDGGLADTVDQRIRDWQPTSQERRFDEIGWAHDLRDARRLAQQHDRRIVLFSMAGKIATGRNLGSVAIMRASSLSNDQVINLLNRYFVPVYIANQDYAASGSAPEEEKAELRRLRQEAAEARIPDNSNQVWVLSPQGHPLSTLETCHAGLSKQLIAYLEGYLPDPRPEEHPPLTAPMSQSRRPPTRPDALVLHLTARYLALKGADYVPEQVELGRSENYHGRGMPAENWVVLERGQWTKFLGRGAPQLGQSWNVDPQVAALLFRYMYPPTEDNDISRNRIEEGTLRATVVATDGGVIRARLDGTLKMKHRQFTEGDDNRFVAATLMGYLDFEPERPTLRSLRLVTTEATYGRNDFGIALRSVP